ncbi:MAG: hypothetical protein IPK37_04210 [Austwickia sp.]|jgi:hypothetical protein|nr:MAG: hypothetical protein IPK37_04210 [Austwickia sp.]
MTFPSRPPLDGDSFPTLVTNARLDLATERHDPVSGLLQMVNGVLDSLDQVELGETPPATAYDARWE